MAKKPIVISAVTDRGTTPRAEFLDRFIEDHAVTLNETELPVLARIEERSVQLLADLEARRDVVEVGQTARRARLERAIETAQDLTAQAHDEMREAIQKGAAQAARQRSQRIAEQFRAGGVGGLQVTFQALNATQLRQVVAEPFFGWDLHKWTEWHKAEDAAKIDRELRMAFLEGDSVDATVARLRRIVNAPARSPAITRKMQVTARTALQSASNAAAAETYKRNRDVVARVRWVATLDNRTCPQCGPLDGTMYPVDEGPRPPIHPQCRCALAPVIRKNLLPGSEPNVPTWSQWITGQFGRLTPEQVERRQVAVLGPSVAGMIQSGEISTGDLVTERGNRRTVAELRALAADRERRAA